MGGLFLGGSEVNRGGGGGGETKDTAESGAARRARPGTMGTLFFHSACLFLVLSICDLSQTGGQELGQSGLSGRQGKVGDWCLAHAGCGEDLFCRHDQCDSFEGWTYACGQCRPCSECRCNNVAIGYVCPLDQCPLGPIDDFKLLETSLHSLQRIPETGDVCYTMIVFEGGSFRQMSFILSKNDYERYLRLGSVGAADELQFGQSHMCMNGLDGSKAGQFRASAVLDPTTNERTGQVDLLLTYTYGHPPGSFSIGRMEQICPRTALNLSVPSNLLARPDIQLHMQQGRSPDQHLEAGTPTPPAESLLAGTYSGVYVKGSKRADASSPGYNNETSVLCPFRLTVSGPSSRAFYFRFQVYECQPQKSASSSLRRVLGEGSVSWHGGVPIYRPGTQLGVDFGNSTLAPTATRGKSEDVVTGRGEEWAMRDVKRQRSRGSGGGQRWDANGKDGSSLDGIPSSLLPLQAPAPSKVWDAEESSAVGAQGSTGDLDLDLDADLKLEEGSKGGGEGGAGGMGRSLLEDGTAAATSFFRADSTNAGLRGDHSFSFVEEFKWLDQSHDWFREMWNATWGSPSDEDGLPMGDVHGMSLSCVGNVTTLALNCTLEYHCREFDGIGGRSTFTEARPWCACPSATFNEAHGSGPCSMCTVITCNDSATGLTTCPPCPTCDMANPSSNNGEPCICPGGYRTETIWETPILQTPLPHNSSPTVNLTHDNCEICGLGFYAIFSPSLHTDCTPCVTDWPSSNQYAEGVSTQSWLQYHEATTLDAGSDGIFPRVCIDALIYFQRVAINGGTDVRFDVAYVFLGPADTIHPLDIVSIWGTPVGDYDGSCDVYRSLSSCVSGANLDVQLGWAYASTDGTDLATDTDRHTPLDRALPFNSFSIVTTSGGKFRAYYAQLFSHKFQRVVAQVDYVIEKDCSGPPAPTQEPFLCDFPNTLSSSKSINSYGPLFPCPAGRFVDESNPGAWCSMCGPNTFSDAAGADECTKCPIAFTSGFEATVCEPCPGGQTTRNLGESCVACETVASELGIDLLDVPGCDTFVAETTTTRPVVITTTPPPVITTTPAPEIVLFCGDGVVSTEQSPAEKCDPGPYPDGKAFHLIMPTVNATSLNLTGLAQDIGKDASQLVACHSDTCTRNKGECGDGVRSLNDSLTLIDGLTRYEGSDGAHVFYREDCDDANLRDGDGCSSECTVEYLWRCDYLRIAADQCVLACGNNILEKNLEEECDDGNSRDGDGCSSECKFECGFECLEVYDIDTGTYYSDCNSECGDGILAADEECDTGLMISDASFGCTSACRFTAGYTCEEISCGSGVQQECDTVCGDEIVKGREECDLGYLNSEGGICLADCKANRDSGCIGVGCNISEAALQEYLERPVELESMGILSQLNSSREGTSSTREGLFFIEDFGYVSPGGRGDMTGTGTMFFGANASGGKVDTFGIGLASANTFSSMLRIGSFFDCPVCDGRQNDIRVPRGVMSDVLRLLTVPVSCSISFDPIQDVIDSTRQTIVKFNFNAIRLLSNESVITFTDRITNTEILSVRGPVTDLTSKTGIGESTYADEFYGLSPVKVDIQHGTTWYIHRGTDKDVSEGGESSLRYNFNWEGSRGYADAQIIGCANGCSDRGCYQACLRPAFKNRRDAPSSSSSSSSSSSPEPLQGGLETPGRSNDALGRMTPPRPQGDKGARRDENRRALTLPADDFVNNMVMGLSTAYDGKTPCDFAQGDDNLILPMVSTASARSPIEGAWFGKCMSKVRCGPSTTKCAPPVSTQEALNWEDGYCNVHLYVRGSELIKHVWGCDLTPWREGMATGVVIEELPLEYLVSDQTGVSLLNYGPMRIMWSQSSVKTDVLDTSLSAVFSFGETFATPGPGVKLQLLTTSDDDVVVTPSIATGQAGRMANINDDCSRLDLEYVPTFAMPIIAKPPVAVETDDFVAYSLCNRTVASLHFHEMQQGECRSLADTLMSRDFLNVMSPAAGQYACSHPCIGEMKARAEAAVRECRRAALREWSTAPASANARYATIKKLTMAAAARRIMTLACATNHRGVSCMTVNPRGSDGHEVSSTACPAMSTERLPSAATFEASTNDTAKAYSECSTDCRRSLDDYVYWSGCCAKTLEDADLLFLEDTYIPMPDGSTTQFDFGDRTNAFSTPLIPQADVVRMKEAFSCKEPRAGRGFGVECKIRQDCQRSNWPPQGCCDIKCANGKKSYNGQCHCECDDGFVGVLCDSRNFHVGVEVVLSGVELYDVDYAVQEDFFFTVANITSSNVPQVELAKVYSISTRRRGGGRSTADDDGRIVRNDGQQPESRRQSGGGVAIAFRVIVRDSREALRVALLLETLVQTPAFVDFTRRSGISSKLTRTQLSGTPSAYNGDGILLNGGQGTASGGSTAGGAGGKQVIVKVAGGIYISYDLAIGLGVGLGTFFLCSCAAACAIINRKKIRRYLSSAEEREEARDKMQESAQNVGGSLLSFLGSRPKEGQSDKVKSTAEIVAQKTREEGGNIYGPAGTKVESIAVEHVTYADIVHGGDVRYGDGDDDDGGATSKSDGKFYRLDNAKPKQVAKLDQVAGGPTLVPSSESSSKSSERDGSDRGDGSAGASSSSAPGSRSGPFAPREATLLDPAHRVDSTHESVASSRGKGQDIGNQLLSLRKQMVSTKKELDLVASAAQQLGPGGPVALSASGLASKGYQYDAAGLGAEEVVYRRLQERRPAPKQQLRSGALLSGTPRVVARNVEPASSKGSASPEIHFTSSVEFNHTVGDSSVVALPSDLAVPRPNISPLVGQGAATLGSVILEEGMGSAKKPKSKGPAKSAMSVEDLLGGGISGSGGPGGHRGPGGAMGTGGSGRRRGHR